MSDTIEADMRRLDYGWDGFKVLTTGQSVGFDDNNDGFYAIKAVEASAEVSATSIRGDGLSAITVLTGDIILGLFSTVTCDSGKILVYLR